MDLDLVTSLGLAAAGVLALAGFSAFGLVSLGERERRAAGLAFALAVTVSLPLFGSAFFPLSIRIGILWTLAVTAVAVLAGLLVPIGSSPDANGRPARRVDERDIMFARARLKPGSPEFEAYYSMRPENRESDDRTRSLPGLLSPHAPRADAVVFAAARASFEVCDALREEVDGPVATERREGPPAEMTTTVKELALRLGARAVGVAELRPYHVYTHVGRGTGVWGEPIDLDHRWAIAFTVEMNHAAMQHAPGAPVVAESARQYAEAAKIAVQIASLLRSLGFPARAHIDGNYRVIAPLVARDAGLGEIGRMGILMTPRLGPRVRLGVVTTAVPLIPDMATDDRSVIDFCRICKKCAENCPGRSISFGDREPVDDGLRWAIDADSCFHYWNAIGTDCGRCMAVCPYSHPDNAAHNLVRTFVRHSPLARKAALHLDDLFYGRHPRPRKPS
jgi:ferredoxin